MDEAQVRQQVLRKAGLRIGSETGRYLQRQLAQANVQGAAAPVPVMGVDARTGVPRRQFINLQDLVENR